MNTTANNHETVLFIVTGLSPGVITSTVWALTKENPPLVPNRIVVLTTKTGNKLIKTELFKKQKDFKNSTVWDCLVQSIQKHKLDTSNKLRFGTTADDIRVFTKRSQKATQSIELDDIVDVEDNCAVADFILEKLRSFVENPECRVIASIAGGRKTMSALLYACMTLIGRETDRLIHVLIQDEYANPYLTPRFYFPEQYARYLYEHNVRKLDARKARVVLADIPFVPLRNRFADIAEMPGGFNSLVKRYSKLLKQTSSHPVSIAIDKPSCTVTIDGISIEFPKRAFLTFVFMIKINSESKILGDKLVSHKQATEMMRNFLLECRTEYTAKWAETITPDDIKRELHNIRKILLSANVDWVPGQRKRSLLLPNFVLQNKSI